MKTPTHVAFIMDGNRRWAKRHGLPVAVGHRQAAEKTLRPLVEYAIKRGIPYLTFWAFSTENRERDREEVKVLLDIFRRGLQAKLKELDEMGVRVKTIGDLDWFPENIAKPTKKIIEATGKNTKITVTIGLNYGGREEIVRAINKLLENRKQTFVPSSGRGKAESRKEVTEGEFAQYLDTSGVPDPDLIVRTAGDLRLSGFLPWQSTYSELYFTPVYWPDFTQEEFEKALKEYARRSRRFGK